MDIDNMDMFVEMLTLQQGVQQVMPDGDPWTMTTNTHRIAFIRTQFEAMIHEMTEAKDECGWKTWGKNEDIHAEAMLRELVDVWCFFMNWMLTLAPMMDFKDNQEFAEWFKEAHRAKSIVNVDRQVQGSYDGFKEKCPQCAREYEAAHWEEEQLTGGGWERMLVCACGYVLKFETLDENGAKTNGG